MTFCLQMRKVEGKFVPVHTVKSYKEIRFSGETSSLCSIINSVYICVCVIYIYNATDRKVASSIPDGVIGIFH